MSAKDIDLGTRWENAIGEALASTSFGVLCLTPENLDSRWILFEAGALAKQIDHSRVVPILFQVAASEVKPPLSQFQNEQITENGIRGLLKAIDGISPRPLGGDKLNDRFNAFWPTLMNTLELAKTGPGPAPKRRELSDVLEEVLSIVRGLAVSPSALGDLQINDVLELLGDGPFVRIQNQSDAESMLRELRRGGLVSRATLEKLVYSHSLDWLADAYVKELKRDPAWPLDPLAVATWGPYLAHSNNLEVAKTRVLSSIRNSPEYRALHGIKSIRSSTS